MDQNPQATFASLFGSMNDNDINIDEVKPIVSEVKEEVKVSEPIKTESVTPSAPVVEQSVTPMSSPNLNFQTMINNNVSTQQPTPTVVNTQPIVQQVETKPVQQVVQPTTVVTQPTVSVSPTTAPIKVDTESKVLGNDDEYFDDFFE